jgi:hypothetical protein
MAEFAVIFLEGGGILQNAAGCIRNACYGLEDHKFHGDLIGPYEAVVSKKIRTEPAIS